MDRLAERWDRGGGHLAAGLWWLAFLLYAGGIVAGLIALLPAHAPPPKPSSTANLKRIDLALLMYVQDYDERLPPMHGLAAARQALGPYAPGEGDPLWRTPELGVPYALNPSLSHRSLGDFADPSRIVTFWDTRLYRGKDGRYRVVAFLDGHVGFARPSDWPRLRAASGIERDAPVAKEPPPRWFSRLPSWLRQPSPGLVGPAALWVLAPAAAFGASWREASVWARGQEAGFLPSFLGRFAVRFLVYGSLVILEAVASVVAALVVFSIVASWVSTP